MRPPPEARIFVPELPRGLDWLNVGALRVDELLGDHALLVEFFDFARVNSVRTLPYVRAWHDRYSGRGLRVIGVHTPGYSLGRDAEVVARAVAHLEIDHAVVLDPDLAVWRLYGNRGWPARYLFDRRGLLRHLHYGEGAYAETEEAIHEVLRELDAEVELPAPMAAVRPEDEPGVLLAAQTADIALPADRDRLELVRDWTDGEDYIEASDAGAAASFSYAAGGAFAVLSGAVAAGLYATDGVIVAEGPGLRLHGVQFTPAPPAEGEADRRG